MPSIEGQEERAVTMEDGLAEMHAQRSVLGLVTGSGGPPGGGSRNTKNEDLTPEPAAIRDLPPVMATATCQWASPRGEPRLV